MAWIVGNKEFVYRRAIRTCIKLFVPKYGILHAGNKAHMWILSSVEIVFFP